MSDEIVILPRDLIYEIFSSSYKQISKNIEDFFGPEENIDKDMVKEYRAFKEMIINSIDNIHKKILEENLKMKQEIDKIDEKKKIKKEEKDEEKKEKDEKGFWEW